MKMEMKTAVVPFSCLEDLRADFANFAHRDDLNDFQHAIVEKHYVLDPKLDFDPKSLVVAVAPMSVITAAFWENGKRFESIVEKPVDESSVLQAISEDNAYHFFYHYWIPAKRTAVRVGLCEYGRNNITYCGEYGSRITIFVFVSDMPAPEKYIWREVTNMPECASCTLCRNACPTGAIREDRFLIDNERCLSYWNEFGSQPFPDWIPKTAHHRLVDCSICQKACPKNRGKFDFSERTVEFSAEETRLLLDSVPLDSLPEETRKKAEDCNMSGYNDYSNVARNLRSLIDAAMLRGGK